MKTARTLLFGLLTMSVMLSSRLAAAPEKLQIGAKPQNFTLTCPAGQQHSLHNGEKPKATVVMFVATQCPVSLAYDARMAEIAREYQAKGVRFLGVNSNKQEAMAEVGEHAKKSGFTFPVVKDPNNVLADKWGALVTPEVFVLDAQGTLQYHGRIDDSQNTAKVKSQDLRSALDAVLAGKKPSQPETKAFGCTIKRI